MILKSPLQRHCKTCDKDFVRYRNRGNMEVCTPCQRAERVRLWKIANPERKREINQRWSEQNREKDRAMKRAWQKAHPELENAKAAKYRAARRQQVAKWADFVAIEIIYSEARRLTTETGVEHHVDHIVPIKGRAVSGLHWEQNLQILTGDENRMKSNHFGGNP